MPEREGCYSKTVVQSNGIVCIYSENRGVKEGMSEAILGHKGDGRRRDVRPNE